MFLKRFKSNVGDEIAVKLISEPQCFAENMYYDDSQFACIFSDSIEKKNPYSTRHSGFYRIRAEINDVRSGVEGYIVFHRGKDIPDLRKFDGIIEYMFTEESVAEMYEDEETKNSSIFALFNLFTQDEVAKVLALMSPGLMNITIEPVMRKSLTTGFPDVIMPINENRIRLKPKIHDFFSATLNLLK